MISREDLIKDGWSYNSSTYKKGEFMLVYKGNNRWRIGNDIVEAEHCEYCRSEISADILLIEDLYKYIEILK